MFVEGEMKGVFVLVSYVNVEFSYVSLDIVIVHKKLKLLSTNPHVYWQ